MLNIRRSLNVILLILCSWNMLFAFHITSTTSCSDMIRTQKIILNIHLDPTERGFYRDTLRFSIDALGIELKSWKASIEPVEIHNMLFKRGKFLYTAPCTIEINVKTHATPVLSTSLYVATIVLDTFGKNHAFTKQITLDHHYNNQTMPVPISPPDPKVSLPTIDDLYNRQTNNLIGATPFFDEDFAFVGIVRKVWQTFIQWGILYLHSWLFFWSYAVALCFLIYTYIQQRRKKAFLPKNVKNECALFSLWYFLGGSICIICMKSSRYWWFYTMAVIMFFTMLYYLGTVRNDETFLDRLKGLIGIIAGATILPLLTKGYLLHNNTLLDILK